MSANPNADPFHEKRDAESVAEAERVAKTTRADCRELARLLRFDADNMDDPDAALRVIRAAELLETSDWFNVEELLTVAEANAELAAHYRRELLRIGVTTQCRHTYNRVAAIFKAKHADDLFEIAKREGAV